MILIEQISEDPPMYRQDDIRFVYYPAPMGVVSAIERDDGADPTEVDYAKARAAFEFITMPVDMMH